MHRPAIIVVLSLAALLWQAQATAQNYYGNAARVNDAYITNERLERYFDEYVKDKGRNITKMINPRVYKTLKREALDKLIDREVLWQAARDKGIRVDEAEVDATLKEMQAGAKTREAYLRRLELSGFDEKAYAEYVRQELASRKYLAQEVPLPEVGEEEIAAFYREKPHHFARPEKVKASHILVRVEPGADDRTKMEARERAASILADLRKGEDFATLAERYSEDTTARGKGGSLGEFGRGQMVKPFEEAVFSLKPGQLSEPVETEYGYHIIRLDAHTPAGTVPLDEVRDRIRKALAAEKRNAAAKKHVEDLRALAKVQIFVYLAD
jgi:parvulin-like peptidyl-prolyl isomerase